MNIRCMNVADVDQVKRIEDQSFPKPWSKNELISETSSGIALIIEEGNRICGYLFARRIIDEIEILNIAVDPTYRNKGIGKRLISEIINISEKDEVRKIFLEVRASNSKAIELYKKSGFKRFSLRKAYYHDGEDAVLMNYTSDAKQF